MSFTVKIKLHKPAISTLSSLYSFSLLSLHGYLSAFTFLCPLKFPKLFPSGYQKARWAPALRTDCSFPLMLWGGLVLTCIAQDQVLPRAVWEQSKTFKNDPVWLPGLETQGAEWRRLGSAAGSKAAPFYKLIFTLWSSLSKVAPQLVQDTAGEPSPACCTQTGSVWPDFWAWMLDLGPGHQVLSLNDVLRMEKCHWRPSKALIP